MANVVLVFAAVLALVGPALAADGIVGGDTLGGAPLPSLASVSHPQEPTDLWGFVDPGPPFPTNAWWGNLVLLDGDQAVNALPYVLKAGDGGIDISYPKKVVNEAFVLLDFGVADWSVGGGGDLGARALSSFGPLHATVEWEAGLSVPVVRGMPYVTVNLQADAPAPVLSSAWAIAAVDGDADAGSVTGERFAVDLDNGQRWIIYASETITLAVGDGQLTVDAAWDGYLRLAVVAGEGASGSESDLDAYAGAIPTGGSVSASSSGDSATYTFDWNVEGDGDLLMMTLPHHRDTISGVTTVSHTLNTLKGDMVGVVGDSWDLDEDLTTIEWYSPSGVDPDRVVDINVALAEDLNVEIAAGDPYFGGKQMAVQARLALIAEEVGGADLASPYLDKVRPVLEAWLDGTNDDPLLYDATWGGVVSSNGISDPNADFGQGYYNDHHFHYGYHVYTAAVLARADPTWADEYGEKVLNLIRDYAEPSGADPYFPQTRNKDWFTGHSWANGIGTAFADSKNQESTSEAVNGYYGVYLYGLATGNEQIKDLGRLLLATEVRTAQRYWQITSADAIYPEPYASNKVVGILWSTKVDYTTWFGANVEFIHCIQMLPFVPISEELLRPEWIEEEYPVLEQVFDSASEEWRGYIIMAHGIIDPEAAWAEAQELTRYDDGNTKSNTLYWLATRPQ